LSFQTTQADLQRVFGEVGEVLSVFLPTDRDSGRPRGFAFVEFADGLTAAVAAQRFDGYQLDGRNIRVNEAQEKSRPSSGSFGGPGMGPPPHRPKSKGSRRNLRARKRSLG
jgi:RNA recognition motif-containing protein